MYTALWEMKTEPKKRLNDHTIHSFREHLCLLIQMYLTVALTIYDVRISNIHISNI